MKLKSCTQCQDGDHLFHSSSPGRKSKEVILVGGHHPYLWVGEDGSCLTTNLSIKSLRALSDALRIVSRRKSRKSRKPRKKDRSYGIVSVLNSSVY